MLLYLLRILFWSYLLFLIVAEALVISPADPDLWHRLALGEAIWKTGHFPPGDVFSYLSDYHTIADHEWGSAVVFYAIYLAGGYNLFVVAKLVTLTTTMALIVWAGMQNRRPTAWTTAFFVLILLALLPSFASTIRCMAFTHIFLALWFYWYQRERQGRPVSTFWYVVSMAAWANLHGGFAIGIAWLGLVTVLEFWYGGLWKRWAIRLGCCFLATLANPFGYELWVSTGRALLVSRAGFEEWAPVDWFAPFTSNPGYKLLLPIFVVMMLIHLYRRGWSRVNQPIVIMLLVFCAISLTSVRHTSLFATAVGALAPSLFPRELRVSQVRDPLQRMGYMALLTAFLIVPFFVGLIILPNGQGLKLSFPSNSCPVAAVEELKARQVKGNLLVPFNYGSYALWELRGEMRVSMDGRYDLVYRRDTYQEVEDFFLAKGDWRKLLKTPAPQAVLVSRDGDVYPKMQIEPGWREVFHDAETAVFLPQSADAPANSR